MTRDTASISPIKDRAKRIAVIEAISRYDLGSSPAGNGFGAHSPLGEIEAMDAVPEGLFETDEGGFRVVATVYVAFASEGRRHSPTTEELPALVRGHFTEAAGKPVAIVDTVEVETTSLEQ